MRETDEGLGAWDLGCLGGRESGWKLELGVDFGKREEEGGFGGLSLEGGGVGLPNERGAEYL